jgi:hypothetical protein
MTIHWRIISNFREFAASGRLLGAIAASVSMAEGLRSAL